MIDPRDDVPLADLDEQHRDLEAEPEPAPGEELPDPEPHTSTVEANEADVLEQSLPVSESEDYPREADEDSSLA